MRITIGALSVAPFPQSFGAQQVQVVTASNKQGLDIFQRSVDLGRIPQT
jgi:hypothetical protein